MHSFPASTTDYFSDIAWTGSALVIVGHKGLVAKSADGYFVDARQLRNHNQPELDRVVG